MDEFDGETSDVRRIAIRRATLVGVACSTACFAFGKPIDASIIDGLIVTLGGLIAWTTYHVISHRSDSLMMVALNTLPIWRKSEDPWLPTLVITGLAMLGVGVVMGLVNRPEVAGMPDRDFVWWDADIDGPR